MSIFCFLGAEWSAPVEGCIQWHNDLVFHDIPDLAACQSLCEDAMDSLDCKSVDYGSFYELCNLSSIKLPHPDYQQPCSDGHYVFSEIIG